MWATNMTIACGLGKSLINECIVALSLTITISPGFIGCGTVPFYWLQTNAVLYSDLHLIIGIYGM